jgi:hypothetical protein
MSTPSTMIRAAVSAGVFAAYVSPLAAMLCATHQIRSARSTLRLPLATVRD